MKAAIEELSELKEEKGGLEQDQSLLEKQLKHKDK